MFALSWKLTLVLLSVVPPVAIGAVMYGQKLKVFRKNYQDRLAEASTVAEESIGSIRTVRSFSNERKSCDQYDVSIEQSYQIGRVLALVQGGFSGATTLLASGAIILVLWCVDLEVITELSTNAFPKVGFFYSFQGMAAPWSCTARSALGF